jgi:monoamine oxidase
MKSDETSEQWPGVALLALPGLAEEGEAALVAFAVDWLAGLRSAVKEAVQRTHATRWSKEPWVLGAASAAAAGGQCSRIGFVS